MKHEEPAAVVLLMIIGLLALCLAAVTWAFVRGLPV